MFNRFPGIDWITPYGVMLVLACVVAWWIARRRAVATGIDPTHVDLALPLAFIAGAFFAGALGWILASENQVAGDAYLADRRRLYAVVIVVLPILYAYCRVTRLPLRRFADLVAIPALAFMAIVRIGCFLAGCCFGDISGHADRVAQLDDASLRLQLQTLGSSSEMAAPWALRFPEGSFAQHQHQVLGLLEPGETLSLPVHPVQLYETALLVALCIALARLRPAFTQPGNEALAALAGYAVIAFLLEFLRADNALVLGPLTLNQLFCAGWLALAATLAARLPGQRPSQQV